ncbi:MAG: hypothetical protein ACREAC_20135, partial [Blastocatellia bacterium]
ITSNPEDSREIVIGLVQDTNRPGVYWADEGVSFALFRFGSLSLRPCYGSGCRGMLRQNGTP